MTTTNQEPSLYDTMNKAYKDKIPICSLVYMAKRSYKRDVKKWELF